MKSCYLIITDSGGIQEEASYFNRPCLILRNETEWTRLVDAGKNFLFSKISKKDYFLAEKLIKNKKFYQKIQRIKAPESKTGAAKKIVSILVAS